VYRKGARFVATFRYRGKQRKKSFRTLTEAKNFKAKAHLGDAPQASSRMLFTTYADSWLDGYSGRTRNGLRQSTRDSYRDIVDRVIIPFFKQEAPSLKLSEIAPADFKRFIAHLAAQGYTPATIRRYFAPLRALVATAAEDGLIARNPAAGFRVVIPNGGEHSRLDRSDSNGGGTSKRLTSEQTKALLAEIPAEHQDLTYLLAACGVRIGEALALTWRDFKTVDAECTHGGESPVLQISTSKTAAGLRTLALSPATARRLMRRRSMVAHSKPDDPIFANADGGQMCQHNFRRRVFRPAAIRAGVPSTTPHQLRHAYATLLAEEGYGAPQIAQALGHADHGQTALRWYIRTKPIAAPSFIDKALGHE
jgi:integrase